MVVTTDHGRYRVEELGPALFEITVLEKLDSDWLHEPPGFTFRVASLQLRRGENFNFDGGPPLHRQILCSERPPRNPIVSIEP